MDLMRQLKDMIHQQKYHSEALNQGRRDISASAVLGTAICNEAVCLFQMHATYPPNPDTCAVGNTGGNMAAFRQSVASHRMGPSPTVLCHPNSTLEHEGAHAQLGMLLAGSGHRGPFQPALHQQQQRQHGQALVRQPNNEPEVPVPSQVQGQHVEQQSAHSQGASRPAHVRQHPSSSGAASRQLRQLAGGPVQQQAPAAQRHTAGHGAQVRQHPSSSGAASKQPRQLAGGPVQQHTLAVQRHTAGHGAQVRQHPSSSGAASRQPWQLAGGPVQQQAPAAHHHIAGRGTQQVAPGRLQAAPSAADAACRAAAAQPAQEAAARESKAPQVECQGCCAWAAWGSVRVCTSLVCSSAVKVGRCGGHSLQIASPSTCLLATGSCPPGTKTFVLKDQDVI